jgi:aminopeptidase
VVEASRRRRATDAAADAARHRRRRAGGLGELGIGTNERDHAGRSSTPSSTRRSAARSTWPWAAVYAESGGTNESAIHWDLITDLRQGGEVLLDGEPWQRDGRFLS